VEFSNANLYTFLDLTRRSCAKNATIGSLAGIELAALRFKVQFLSINHNCSGLYNGVMPIEG
jgi:hypothetical protein